MKNYMFLSDDERYHIEKIVTNHVALYNTRKAKMEREIDNLCEYRAPGEFMGGGGQNISQPESAALAVDAIHKKFADVFKIGLCLNNVIANEYEEEYGKKLAHAIVLNCTNGKRYTHPYLESHELVYDSQSAFYRKREKFIFDVASQFGLLAE